MGDTMYRDSVDKIVGHAFVAVAKEPFSYDGHTYEPFGRLFVSNLIFRSDSCPMGCGGCCMKPWSLDYLPGEAPGIHTGSLVPRVVPFNGGITVLSDMQNGQAPTQPCRHLGRNGFCSIHDDNPLSCDLPLLEFQVPSRRDGTPRILHKKFGRGWNMRRVDGERGAQCSIEEPVSPDEIRCNAAKVRGKLMRLHRWADHFGLDETWLPEILIWIDETLERGTVPPDGLRLG